MNAITGTFCVGEAPDSITTSGGIGTLEEMYLLALCQRDAKIWKAYYHADECRTTPETEITIPPHNAPHGGGSAHVSKRQAKKAQREQQHAADEARVAKFVSERHPYAAAFSSGTFELKTPEPKPAPRPPASTSSARAIALVAGAKTYVRETPCQKCGNRIYRTHSYKCAECDRQSKRRDRRKSNSLKRSKSVARRIERD
jgi:ribosomal protein L37E